MFLYSRTFLAWFIFIAIYLHQPCVQLCCITVALVDIIAGHLIRNDDYEYADEYECSFYVDYKE